MKLSTDGSFGEPEQEQTLATRLRSGAADLVGAVDGFSQREVQVAIMMHDVFSECADELEKKDADMENSRKHADNLRSAIGKLTEELESVRARAAEQLRAERNTHNTQLEVLRKCANELYEALALNIHPYVEYGSKDDHDYVEALLDKVERQLGENT